MAKIVFRATAGLYIQFLNFLKENEVSLSKIEKDTLGFSAICDSKDYFFIAQNSRKFQTKVRIVKKKGLYFKIRKLLKRKGIWVSVVLFYLMIFLYSHLIWDINIKTEDLQLKNKIAGQLFNRGIYAGSIYSDETLNQAADKIMLANQSLGYITLNFYKGVLDCNIYKRTDKEDYIYDLGTDNIYAAKSGIVTDIRVYDGYSHLQLGQSVSQGDIIVSNIYTDRHGNIFTGKTRAYIEAVCDETYRVFVPYEKEVRILTGLSDEYKSIFFAGNEFTLHYADLTGWYGSVKTEKIEYFSFMGFRFPFTVKTATYHQTRQLEVKKDISVALSYGKLQLQHIIENDVKLKKEITRHYSYINHDGGLEVICNISGIYEIT